MRDYFFMLKEVREHSVELLGAVSLERLEAFTSGWSVAETHYGHGPYNLVGESEYFREFQRHLTTKYGLPEMGTAGHCSVLRLVSSGDEAAFHLYFQELDLFPKSKPDPQRGNRVKTGICPFNQMMDYICEKPPLYLGIRSVTRLRAYLDGYAYGAKKLRPGIKLDPDMAEFEVWLRERERMPASIRWERLALACVFDDETHAFAYFVKNYKAWRSSQSK